MSYNFNDLSDLPKEEEGAKVPTETLVKPEEFVVPKSIKPEEKKEEPKPAKKAEKKRLVVLRRDAFSGIYIHSSGKKFRPGKPVEVDSDLADELLSLRDGKLFARGK